MSKILFFSIYLSSFDLVKYGHISLQLHISGNKTHSGFFSCIYLDIKHSASSLYIHIWFVLFLVLPLKTLSNIVGSIFFPSLLIVMCWSANRDSWMPISFVFFRLPIFIINPLYIKTFYITNVFF